MSKLTTHVLDTHAGCPAAGMAYTLERRQTEGWITIARGQTNADGRTDQPLLQAEQWQRGQYRLTFGVGEYFRGRGVALTDPAFLEEVPLQFGLGDSAHYHVPLLCSPWSYATYRGS